MASDASSVLNMGNLVTVSGRDTEGNDPTPRYRPGGLAFKVDSYGYKIMLYGRNRNGSAVVRGECMSYVADTSPNVDRSTSAGTITAGTTTSATTSSLTANDHDGMLFYVTDNADAAGTAPEGETGIVASNTATLITLEADYPLSAAIANADTAQLIANHQFEDSVDGDEAWCVAGCVVAAGGVSDGNYGWVGMEGMWPVLYTTAAVTVGDPIVADAASFLDFGSDGQELQVGICPEAVQADLASPFRALGLLKLFTYPGPAAAP
mgnify:CR=1 FL=1